MKRTHCNEKAQYVRDIQAAVDVTDASARAAKVPNLPLHEEERKRIFSVYGSLDSEAEPTNM